MPAAKTAGTSFAPPSGVDHLTRDDEIDVNCGRCGKPLKVRVIDVKDQRTIECGNCERRREPVLLRPRVG